MKIGLVDVDAEANGKPKFPNLALMRISAWHKSQGDEVEWYQPPLITPWYDIVYMSKVFSDAYTPDIPEQTNADKVIKGGTGYCISLVNGKEVFDASKNVSLPPEMEKMFPDYSIYPMFDFAISMTSRGCPRGCSFCIVGKKEGRCAKKVADVKDFWTPETGKKEIKVLDPNILACAEKRDLLKQYRETGAVIEFNQGLDIRFLDDDDIADLTAMRLDDVHFAWDNPREDLSKQFENWVRKGKRNRHGHYGRVYTLTNFNTTMEENLYRIYTLRELGYQPYVMVYNAPEAPQEILALRRWCNSFIISSVPRFEDYSRTIAGRPNREESPQQTLF